MFRIGEVVRQTFINELINQARLNDKVFLITADLGFSVLEPFAEEFPDRFLNIGIAEQNMIGFACGLAKEGFKVFVYSIGNFPTLRCLEQIRYDVCYHNFDVNIISVGAGYAYGPLGVSHHTTEDIGIMRSIPNLIVSSPSDQVEVKSLVEYFCNNSKPCYMRLNKNGEPRIHTINSVDITKPIQIINGKNKLFLSTGAISYNISKYCKEKNYSHIVFPIISPLSENWIESLVNYEEVHTFEEHQLNCGFGSAILELLNDKHAYGQINGLPKIFRHGIKNEFIGYSGSQEFLINRAGINPYDLDL